jgi:ribonuclease BN (tRNA processing enzyme)
MNIRFLGTHNRESSATSCACLIIDDNLAVDAGGLTSNLSYSEQDKLGAILISHQHYDHIRDIPGIALNRFISGTNIQVYSVNSVLKNIESHLLNGIIYPRFQNLPEGKPSITLNSVKTHLPEHINGHKILALPVRHFKETIGYEISDKEGKSIFYTSDTGPGLVDCWKYTSPQLLIIDVTLPSSYEKFARQTGHLTPDLLKLELITFKEHKGYLPKIVSVHMDARFETVIKEELAIIAEDLNADIIVSKEGQQLQI